MKLLHAPLNKDLSITLIQGDLDSDIFARLWQLGFVAGSLVVIEKRAPFSMGPILVRTRGRQIGLSPSEANLIEVQLC